MNQACRWVHSTFGRVKRVRHALYRASHEHNSFPQTHNLLRSSHKSYKVVHVSAVVGDKWEDLEGESFLYRDGTSNSPGPGIVILQMNYLGWARAMGFVLLFISWAVSLVLSFAVWWWREKQHIKGGQPIFLQVLLCGSFVTSGSILTLSFDESIGLGQSGLSFACQLTPWLFFVGMTTMYAGLFCKLWRVDKITQFRRRSVTATQVLWPLVALLVSTVSILAVWTVVDPWARERYNEGASPPVSFGQCESNHFAWFLRRSVVSWSLRQYWQLAWRGRQKTSMRTEPSWTAVLYFMPFRHSFRHGLVRTMLISHASLLKTTSPNALVFYIHALVGLPIDCSRRLFGGCYLSRTYIVGWDVCVLYCRHCGSAQGLPDLERYPASPNTISLRVR
jgi:hypothetical protein